MGVEVADQVLRLCSSVLSWIVSTVVKVLVCFLVAGPRDDGFLELDVFFSSTAGSGNG